MNPSQRSTEHQQDFFGDAPASPKRVERLRGINDANKPILWTTSIEQLIVAGIVAILIGALSFYLGLVRGKWLTRSASAAAAPAIPPAPRATLQPSAVRSAEKPYVIQLASYKQKEAAEAEAAVLRRTGYAAGVIRSGEHFVLLAGQYANQREAQKDLKALTGRFRSAFLRRR